MAPKTGYRVKQTTVTTLTGAYSLESTIPFSYNSFVDEIGNGNQCWYVVSNVDEDAETGDWEIGVGTVTDGSPDTISRDQILANSQGTLDPISWGAGVKDIWSEHPVGIMQGSNALQEIVDASVQSTARTNLGLGSIATKAETDYVDITGDTMTGLLVLSADPSADLGAATKQYADLHLPKTGGTMTGDLTLNGDPDANLKAAPKQYVDAAKAAALNTAFQCEIYHSVQQSIANQTWTAKSFNSEVRDIGGMHNTSTNNSRITIPASGAGVYIITAFISFVENHDEDVQGRIMKNDTTILAHVSFDAPQTSPNQYDPALNLSWVGFLDVSDYIEVELIQRDGSKPIGAGTDFNRFCAARISVG
jgi:hypothetical protein